jgi:hypothetical protein
MKVIIAGSRSITDYKTVESAIKESKFEITEIISGGARGVDKLGELYAVNNNIKLTIMKADWDKHGKSAGYIRNQEMSEIAEAVIILWDGASKGTKNMLEVSIKKGLKSYVKKLP